MVTQNIVCFFFLFIIISADEDKDGAQDRMKTKIKVNHNGTNTWLAPTILQSSCKINVRYFPFDEQVGLIGLHIMITNLRRRGRYAGHRNEKVLVIYRFKYGKLRTLKRNPSRS